MGDEDIGFVILMILVLFVGGIVAFCTGSWQVGLMSWGSLLVIVGMFLWTNRLASKDNRQEVKQ